MEAVAIILGVLSGLGTAWLTFRFFFSDSDDFWECVKFSFTPNIISLFRGEYWDDVSKSFKLSIWILISYLAGWGMCAVTEKVFS